QLVDDRMLLADSAAIRAVLEQAKQEAQRYTKANPVPGRNPVELKLTDTNTEDDDVVFGTLAKPRDKQFHLADLQSGGLHLINAVRVAARRTRARGNPAPLFWFPFQSKTDQDMERSATATLDNFVVGFRPQGALAIPLAPIGLRSDPVGINGASWESQVKL